jgi:GntR family transcriptional regulator
MHSMTAADPHEAPADRLSIRLSQASGVPFYRQIVDQVAGLIHSGQLAPDTRLPSFRDLAPRLLVSLITVRRAYADLEAAGLIVRRQGQGTFVASAVEGAARRRALTEAKALLETALGRARQLGLQGDALRDVVEGLLATGERDARPGRAKGEAR